MSIQDKQRHFQNILNKAKLQSTLPTKNTGDKKNDKERQKDACTTCKDAINDTIASMKADLGILHETVRIKTIECQKLNQYCSGVERQLI